jgi:hypothetical protein
LERAIGDEEESPEALEREWVGLMLRIREERYMRTVLEWRRE